MKKRLRLGILPGGYNKYVDSLLCCLKYVRKENPSKENFDKWFEKTLDAKPKDEYIRTIKSLNLVKEIDNAISLADIGKKFLDTDDNGILYQELDNNYEVIHDILELLYTKTCPVEEILSFLREKVGVPWEGRTQCEIRLNWLCSLGYISKKRCMFSITGEGRAIVDSAVVEEVTPPHDEIQKHLIEIAKNYDLVGQPEYLINGNKVDVVWIRSGAENPWAAFEVQLRGNMHQALANLTRARRKWNCRTFLLTTKKQKSKVERLVNEAFPELTDLKILAWSDISMIESSAKEFFGVSKKIFGKSWSFRFYTRKPGRSRKR